MKNMKKKRFQLAALIALSLGASPLGAATGEPRQSVRLERAKDYIAEEQWQRAIEELKAAAANAREKHRDEALFWLAHSQHQVRDLPAALKTITDLQTAYPKSAWVKPAASLRIEIAQKLNRTDVLWGIVQPNAQADTMARPTPMPPGLPPPSATPPASAPLPAAPPAAMPFRRTPSTPAPQPTPAIVSAAPTAPAVTSTRRPSRPGAAPAAPAITVWMPEGWQPDTSHRIQALGSLMQTDSQKVIPILKEIALESPDANEARRAVFVLAQSGKPEAYATVLEVARRGSETVQIAAVRELGRFGGRDVAEQLVQVYGTVSPRVKYQVVDSLGERSATAALLRIAETEPDKRLKETAIVRLGQAGARDQLHRFYLRARGDQKEPIIRALVLARAEDELIRIAESEKDESVRRQAIVGLRLLGTPKARAFVDKREIEKREQNR